MAKEKIKVKTETTAEAYVVEVIEPKIDTIQEDINQTKLDQKTCLGTIISNNDSLKEAFEEMKQQKAEGDTIIVCTKEDVRKLVKEEVSSSMKNALSRFDMKAYIPDFYFNKFDQRLDKMDASLKRPPLMKVNMNLSAKILVIIIMVLLAAGVAGYFWFVNTPMYLSHQLYQSHRDIYGGAPGSKYDWAYRNILAGHRDKIKSLIKTNRAQKEDYRAYTDSLRQILSNNSIRIVGILYGESEKIIDFTDSTNIYKSAHFDKKGGIRVTADDRMISLEDTKRKTNIKWKKVR